MPLDERELKDIVANWSAYDTVFIRKRETQSKY
jgi:hypothetical protein